MLFQSISAVQAVRITPKPPYSHKKLFVPNKKKKKEAESWRSLMAVIERIKSFKKKKKAQ